MGRWGWELPLVVDHGAFHAYNKMHVGFKVQVEWEIGGLKMKMETPHEKIWFHKTKILPSFPSWCSFHQLPSLSVDGFTYKVIGDYNFDPIAQGWVGDYLCISLNLQKFVISSVSF
jgi:hypothetical protein